MLLLSRTKWTTAKRVLHFPLQRSGKSVPCAAGSIDSVSLSFGRPYIYVCLGRACVCVYFCRIKSTVANAGGFRIYKLCMRNIA